MIKNKLLTLPALLMTAATGAAHRGRQGPPGHRPRPAHAQPDRNAVTPLNSRGFFASEAPQGASAQNLRIGRKGKRETTLKGSPNTANGAPPFLRPFGSKPAELERPTFGRLPVAFQGAYITPYIVSVGAPAAYPRLLRGDGLDKSLTLGHV